MKPFLSLASTLLLIFICSNTSFGKSKKVVTDTVTVNGICEMCQKRIVDAAYIPGVKRAEWDVQTHILTVSYRTDKTDLHHIEESIAKTGHDTRDVKADTKNYKTLPSCCAYRDGAVCNDKH